MYRILVVPHQRVEAVAYGPSQFQQGGSLAEFLHRFCTEVDWAAPMKGARRAVEFGCMRSGDSAHCMLGRAYPRLLHRGPCRAKASPKAGTPFVNTNVTEQKRFLPIHRISQAKRTHLAPPPLKRQSGVNYPTAWLMHQKIMKATASCDPQYRPSAGTKWTVLTSAASTFATRRDMELKNRIYPLQSFVQREKGDRSTLKCLRCSASRTTQYRTENRPT